MDEEGIEYKQSWKWQRARQVWGAVSKRHCLCRNVRRRRLRVRYKWPLLQQSNLSTAASADCWNVAPLLSALQWLSLTHSKVFNSDLKALTNLLTTHLSDRIFYYFSYFSVTWLRPYWPPLYSSNMPASSCSPPDITGPSHTVSRFAQKSQS